MSFFQVVIPPLDQPYVYQIPTTVFIPPEVGQRVLVPLRNQRVTGYFWGPAQDPGPEKSIKMIEQILDPQPFFSPSLRGFFSWISRYYHHPLGQVVKAALPPGLAVTSLEMVEITPVGAETLKTSSLPRLERDFLIYLAQKKTILGYVGPRTKKIGLPVAGPGLDQ
jgi:primosomal protein N' (replication factor Y)